MSEIQHRFEGAGYGAASRFQINENNKRRAKPTVKYEYHIDGPIRQEVMTHAANQKNAAIARDNRFMEKRLARRKGQAKSKFNHRSDNSWGLD